MASGLLVWQGGSSWAISGWMLLTSLLGILGVLLVRPIVATPYPAVAPAGVDRRIDTPGAAQ